MSEIAHKSIETFVTRVVMQVCGLLGSVAVARALGPAGKGTFVYAVTVFSTLLMATSGQGSAIAWEYTKRHRDPASLFRLMTRVVAAISIVACAGLAVTGWVVPGQAALLAVAIALPFALFAQSSTGFFLADSNIRSVWIQQAFTSILAVIVYIPVLLIFHGGITVLLAIWVCSYIAGAVYTLWALRGYSKARDGVHETGGKPLLREHLGYGMQVSLNSVVSYLNFRIDVFLVMMMLGQSALGIYSIGIGVGETLWQLSRPISTASFGRIARGSESEAAQLTATCMRHSFLLVLIASILTFIFAPPLVILVYGKAFAQAGLVTRVLLPGIIAYSMMPPLAVFYSQQLGRPRLPLLFSALSMFLCAGITAATLPRFGLVGGAFATSVSYTIAFLASAMYFMRHTGVSPRRLFVISKTDLIPYKNLLSKTLSIFTARRKTASL